MDGVLNNLGAVTLREFQKRGWAPPEFTCDDISAYNFEDWIPNLTKEQVYAVFREGDVFWKTQPDLDAVRVLADLRMAGVAVHIVTSRNFSDVHRKVTEEWLRKYGFQFDRLAIYGKHEKGSYAEAQRLDVFIEDHLPTAEEMTDICRVSILLDQPYNHWKHAVDGAGIPIAEPPNLVRMYCWKEISQFFFGY